MWNPKKEKNQTHKNKLCLCVVSSSNPDDPTFFFKDFVITLVLPG